MPNLHDALEALRAASGPRGGDSSPEFDRLPRIERIVAYFLFRTLGGRRWKAALDGLREAELLSPDQLAAADLPEIVEALREKRIDASAAALAPLRHIARWAGDQVEAGLLSPEDAETDAHAVSSESIRESLGEVKGIGPATADGIALFALDRPGYPVDRATYRVVVRHGWLDPGVDYDEARDLIVDQVRSVRNDDDDATLFLRDVAHAMDHVGRQFCRAKAPRCQGCPLEPFLPAGGPYEHDG